MKVHVLPILATMVLGVLLLSGVVLAKDKYCHSNCKGTGSGEQLSGDGSKNKLLGLGGPDSVYGNGGGDKLFGGTGGDEVRGGSGKDYIEGGSGCDRLYGKVGFDTIVDESGGCSGVRSLKDELLGGSGNDTIRAQDGKKDIIRGGPGRDTAYVDDGVDKVEGVEFVPGNKPPVANNDCYNADSEDSLKVADGADDVLSNDPDSGDTLEAVLVSGPFYATTFKLNKNGSFEYNIGANDSPGVPDSFTYKATDGAAKSNDATVTITFSFPGEVPDGGERVQC